MPYFPPPTSYVVSVKDFGAVCDGVTDDTTALNAAFASGLSFCIPGPLKITNKVAFSTTVGQTAFGLGHATSYLVVESDFTMGATAIVEMNAREQGFLELGIQCAQPDVSTRAACNQYPVALDLNAQTRPRLDGVRVSGGWDGIDATGNTGGAKFGEIEIGCLNTGLEVDGALDFFHVDSFHFWPFGISGLATLLASVYSDGATIAVTVGLCDGLGIDKLSTFQGRVVFDANGTGSAGRSIGVLHLDGDGARLTYASGPLWVSACYSTKTTSPAVPSIHVTGGDLQIAVLDTSGGENASAVLVAAGELRIGGGRLEQTRMDQPAAEVTGGALTIDNVAMAPATGTHTVPYIRQTSGQLRVRGCDWTFVSTSTGYAVGIATTNYLHDLTNNQYGGWTVSLPTAIVSGRFDPLVPRNIAYNPDFTIHQRMGAAGSSVVAGADNTYYADRWRLLSEVNIVVYATDEGSQYITLQNQTDGAAKFGLFQVLPKADTYLLRGRTVVLSTQVAASGTFSKFKAGICEWTGTADATTGDPISAWGADGVTPTLAAGWAFLNTPVAFAADVRITASATVGASAKNLALLIWNDDKTYTVNDFFRVMPVWFGIGSVDPGFVATDIVAECARCEAFCYKTFPKDTAPAQNVGLDSGEFCFHGTVVGAAGGVAFFRFPSRMYKVPTVTLYNPAAANAQVRNVTAAGDCSATSAAVINDLSVVIQYTGNAGGAVGDRLALHILAEAEI